MPYIGRDTDKISNVEILDNITFDGSSSYTLQKGGSNFTPSSANTILLSIDGVVQAGNFTVSGSTIDFGTAVAGTSTCDFVLHYGVGLITAPSDGTVTTAKLADSSVSLAKLTATGTKSSSTFLRGDNSFQEVPAGGITEADQWRLTADYTWSSPGDLTANLERVDSTGWGKIGTGMSESSGIFTFPSTGIWFIKFNTTAYLNGDRRSHYIHIKNTTNNSSYNNLATAISHIKQSESNTTYIETSTETLLDVTDLTNDKVKFSTFTSATFVGNTSESRTHMMFIRLGDT